MPEMKMNDVNVGRVRRKGGKFGPLSMAVGALAFGEFAVRRWYPGALCGLFVIGAGLSLLQTASNPYISILGPIETAARRIAFMGICNKAAGGLAPYVFGALLLGGVSAYAKRIEDASPAAKAALQHAFVARAFMPYVVMAVVLALMAILVVLSSLPEIRPADSGNTAARARSRSFSMNFRPAMFTRSRLRPVTTPNSWPFLPRYSPISLVSSVGKGPEPTRVV